MKTSTVIVSSTDAAFSVNGPDETGEESLSPAFR